MRGPVGAPATSRTKRGTFGRATLPPPARGISPRCTARSWRAVPRSRFRRYWGPGLSRSSSSPRTGRSGCRRRTSISGPATRTTRRLNIEYSLKLNGRIAFYLGMQLAYCSGVYGNCVRLVHRAPENVSVALARVLKRKGNEKKKLS